MLTFSKMGKGANLRSLIFFTIAFQAAFGLECWECDSRNNDDPTNWDPCGNRRSKTIGESKPCDIPNGMCVNECQTDWVGNTINRSGTFELQTCTNDTSFVGSPGKCESKTTEFGPGAANQVYMCACDTDNCNIDGYSCSGPTFVKFITTEKPQ